MLSGKDIYELMQEVHKTRPGLKGVKGQAYQQAYISDDELKGMKREYGDKCGFIMYMLEMAFYRGRLDAIEQVQLYLENKWDKENKASPWYQGRQGEKVE